MPESNLSANPARPRDAVVDHRYDPALLDRPNRHQHLAAALGGRVISNESGSFCLVSTTNPPEYAYGNMPAVDAMTSDTVPLSAFTKANEPGDLCRSSLLFLDTETTGLGGTGTVAFVVGCGVAGEHEFEVRQYVIPDYADEPAMLQALQEEFTDTRTMVTYNGAAFDLPLLRDRLIVNRLARDLARARHIDLLHPVRRLFRRRLGDCSLVNVERVLLDFHRTEDVPGYLIPSMYFEWLSEQNPRFMAAVLEHNRRDVVSLYYLALYLGHVFETEGSILETVDDLYSLSRLYSHRKEHERTLRLCGRIEAIESKPEDEILLFQAQALKRAGAYEKAVLLWKKLGISPSREGYWANVELAKYYEHRDRDFEKALAHATRANQVSQITPGQKALLSKRIHRLTSRLSS
ncbi:MAG TPA: ribonuclease H-like domain-containing protein [Candidatus Deferrimicrobium sp.]|nr:ribonuclease H-like domain-containing protein [Candidatus Deferrimicrobium sp.]